MPPLLAVLPLLPDLQREDLTFMGDEIDEQKSSELEDSEEVTCLLRRLSRSGFIDSWSFDSTFPFFWGVPGVVSLHLRVRRFCFSSSSSLAFFYFIFLSSLNVSCLLTLFLGFSNFSTFSD